ncbi:MAG: RNA polymerase sigma-54 factor [Acidobacteria bacterium]|nr:MAG: RNA polymerase sigma-54 factor [Acidobacteriota bacterium]
MAYQDLKLVTKLAQKQVLTPGLVQMVSLLTLNKLELTDMIQQELVQNPVLEEGTEIVESTTPEIELDQKAPDGSAEVDGTDAQYEALLEAAARDHCVTEPEPTAESTVEVAAPAEPEPAVDDPYGDIDFQSFDQYLNDGASRPRETEIFEKPSFENFLAKPQTLTDHLEWQLGLATVEENIRVACHSIIGNLNEDGYLCAVDENGREIPITLEEIGESGEHTLEEVQKALEVVQHFDPPGVSARDLRECLLIQLRILGEEESLAVEIVRDHLHKLQNKQFKEIAKALNKALDMIMDEVEIIKQLDPRPGQKYNKSQPRLIEPDVFIVKVGGQYTVVTNEDEVPQLRLSPTYRHMLERGAVNKDVKNYVKDCFKSAVQLLKNIEQRKHIIVKVCEAIIRRQTEFLDKGIDQLKPMMIKDVAEEVGVHPSTVSRAVANKFAHTPQGVFELRFFFSEAVNGPMGNGTSLLIVKRKVKKYIENEDPRNPLTDEKIALMLKEEGISVTRRSITKYREDLKIPSTHQRRVRS